MHCPSDDQNGFDAFAVPVRNRLAGPPSMFATYSSGLPDARTSKTMLWLSGDQLGLPTSGPAKEVNWRGFELERSLIQTSALPERYDWNAMDRPFGEMRAPESPRLELTNFTGAVAASFCPPT